MCGVCSECVVVSSVPPARFPSVCLSLTPFFFSFLFFSEFLASHLSLSTRPSFPAIVPHFSIIHLPMLHYPSLFPSFCRRFYSLTQQPAILSPFLLPPSMILPLSFPSEGKKKTNTCLLVTRLSPASPNLSLHWYWLTGASAVLVLADSSRWGIALPLNQCPAVAVEGEVCARHTTQRRQQQQQQPSALAALHEASHGDGMTFRQPGPAGESHTNTHLQYTHTHIQAVLIFLANHVSAQNICRPRPGLHLSSAETDAQQRIMGGINCDK